MIYILLPIHPKWCFKILIDDKGIEVRSGTTLYKVINRLIKEQGKAPCLVYCTKGDDVLLMAEDYDYGSMTYYAPKPELIEKPTRKASKEETELYRYYSDKRFKDTEHEWKLNGKVIAEFEASAENIFFVDGCFYETDTLSANTLLARSCLGSKSLHRYLGGKNGTAILIDKLKTFDKPKELREFEKQGSYLNPSVKCRNKGTSRCNKGMSLANPHKWVGCIKARITKAPQSWCYAEVKQ